ncbi:MAG: AhpC/TSA family protein [Bacteroidales bacterium]|jgi:thiol-disulfide isomerase/thioredoxin|nr:AhpC/TSA family protein [Bacteroidales bacterium]
MKKILLLLIPLAILSGCRKNDSFTVNGTIKDHTHEYITITKVDINSIEFIDSAKISSNGRFRIRIKATEPDFYQAGFSPTNFMTLLAEPGEKINLTFADENLYLNYAVEGSEGSELVQTLDYKLLDTRRKLDSLDILFKKASTEPEAAAVQEKLSQEALAIAKAQRRFNIEFVVKNITSLATIKALYQKLNDKTYVLYDKYDLQYLKIASDSLTRYYPDSRHTKALVKSLEEGIRELNAIKLNQLVENLPETKLDPVLKDINGRIVALSSLRGKYVLLAFWSSESRDCIAENLQLKEFYKIYNKKGFEIYQISLDTDEAKWKAAVKFDELPWISTREDDPENPRNALLFNVKSVPANYLFDPKGNIIESNLHGKALQLRLLQLLNN